MSEKVGNLLGLNDELWLDKDSSTWFEGVLRTVF
jgi:hypothetical protein